MKTKTKKGFTLVELVIVIAVIAVLAAVLIPTFSSLIDKANESKDIQLIRNLNTALQSDVKEHKTMTEALEAAENFGYNISKINASATDNEILWDSVNDVFCYLNNENIEYIPDTTLGTKTVAYTKYYQICEKVPSTQTYSIYWIGENNKELNLTVGFDAGYTNDVSVNYTGSSKDVVIKTNGGNLTIDNDDADVIHYGAAQSVKINKCASSSYHEFGQVYQMSIKKGHIVIENGAYVSEITEVESEGSVDNNGGYINSIPENSNINQGTSQTIEIGTAAELATFRDSVNMGITYEGLTIKLTADISLSGYENWLPIGHERGETKTFNGIFDGQGYTISNLNIDTTNKVYDFCGYEDIALFGKISGASLKNFTVEGKAMGNSIAGVVASCFEGSVVEAVTSNVTLIQPDSSANARTGGICDMAGWGAKFINCTNNGKISSANGPTGGIVGFADHAVEIKNCINTGIIENTIHNDNAYSGLAGGIVGYISCGENGDEDMKIITISECTNEGDVKGFLAGGIIANFTGFSSSQNKITSCTNNGDVTSYGDNGGGIVGNGENITIKDCVVNSKKVEAYSYCGGLVGCLNGINEINNCSVNNNINLSSTNSKSIGCLVGLVGSNKGAENAETALTIVGIASQEGLFGQNRVANKTKYMDYL